MNIVKPNRATLFPKKCLVKGCGNYSDGGTFIGDLCAPCHRMITTGVVHHANPTFIGDLFRAARSPAPHTVENGEERRENRQ